MNKQIVAIFLTLLMIGTIFVISPSNLQVGASSGGGDNGFCLDGNYIKQKTKDLSDIVKNYYDEGEIEKGRAFGTKGEQHAADDIATWMGEIGLDDPTCGDSYLEKIYNIPSKLRNRLPTIPLRGKLIVKDMELKINDVEVEDGEYHIQPQWGDSLQNLIIKSKLTTSIDESDLKVVRAPTSYAWFKNFINSITDFDEFSGESFISFVLFLLPRFEEYYNFSFSELNESNICDKLPWLNNTDYFPEPAGGGDFVYIRENPKFNPDPFDPDLPPIYGTYRNIFGGLLPLSLVEMIIWNVKNKILDKPQCKGIILYDHNEDNNTYDMNYRPYHPLPTIYITYDDGKDMDDNPRDYTIDYSIDQEWDQSVDCYNVIGQINGTNTEETDIVCCLYDSWWNQGTADAAIGMGIILAIAKYMKQLDDLGIKPIRNVQFIAFGGEEYGMRGAYYYEVLHRIFKEKINTIIDLNQLGFTHADPRLTFDVFIHKKSFDRLTPVITEIQKTTNLLDRTGNAYDFSTVDTDKKDGWPVISDYLPFIGRRGINTLSFMKTRGPEQELMKWKFHHRDGGDHSHGDVMYYYNNTDVNVTAEFIWNVTKYFMINPNCWFEDGYPSSTLSDRNDDGIYDTVNVSFMILLCSLKVVFTFVVPNF